MGEQVTKEKLTACNDSIRAILDAIDLVGGKWKLAIIASLCYQKMRFSELQKNVTGISSKVLSRELKDLEMNQLITRQVLDTQPVSVEYSITPYGKSLKELNVILAEWGLRHRKKIMASKKAKD